MKEKAASFRVVGAVALREEIYDILDGRQSACHLMHK